MKRYIALLCLLGMVTNAIAEDITTRICRLYGLAGYERYKNNTGKAKHIERSLNALMSAYHFISITSCPKEYQKYGIYAKPRYPGDGDDDFRPGSY